MALPDRFLRLITLLLIPASLLVPVNGTLAATKKPHTVIHEDAQHIREALRPVIQAAQEKFHIPGISLILVRDNEVLWSESFGYADKAARIPVTEETLFRAGSLAKPFTAFAVMQLAEQGKIDIDQPLFSYLPEFAIKSRFDSTAKPITLRSVLDHHSGLPTNLNKGMWSQQSFRKVAGLLHDEYTAYPPNLVFSYSNIGYTLLGHMIENVSRETFAGYMREHVFTPLGMQHTRVKQVLDDNDQMATGYRDGKPMQTLPIRDVPAFGLYTTTADLGSFLRSFLSQDRTGRQFIVSSETVEEMLEPQNQDIPLDLNIINGLGWFIEEDTLIKDSMLLRHGGTTLLFSSELILAPEQGLGVAILANAQGSRQLVSELAEEIILQAASSCASQQPLTLDLANIQHTSVEDSASTGMPGEYVTDYGLISIQAITDRLCGCIGEKTFDLIPYPNGWFGMQQEAVDSLPPTYRPLGELKYKSGKIDGIDVIIAQGNGRQMVLGERVAAAEVTDVWQQRSGTYQVLNADRHFPITDTQLLIINGRLYMKYRMPLLSKRPIQVPLQPISDSEAIILGLGRSRGETLYVSKDDNGQELVHYSGFFGRKID